MTIAMMRHMMRTARLVMREWRESDRDPFAELNADPEVMRHFMSTMSREQSDGFVDKIEAGFAERGWGLWALELDGAFIGYTGLQPVSFDAHFTPATEIGWRLARGAWGHGYASEAARAAAAFAFTELGLDELVSFTTAANARSRAVMDRIGMTHDPADDFDHPALPAGHEQRPHVLYRLRALQRT
jgi:ribosomal-protein-alanine N-acetyltransferase